MKTEHYVIVILALVSAFVVGYICGLNRGDGGDYFGRPFIPQVPDPVMEKRFDLFCN